MVPEAGAAAEAVAFSPAGPLAAVGDSNSCIHTWDVRRGVWGASMGFVQGGYACQPNGKVEVQYGPSKKSTQKNTHKTPEKKINFAKIEKQKMSV